MAPQYPPPPQSPRRPLPQPVEESNRGNRASPTKEMERSSDATGSKPRRPLPQPVETPIAHPKKSIKDGMSHKQLHDAKTITSTSRSPPQLMESAPPAPAQTPRRFVPQMIETTRRRRKSTDTTPCVTPSDKTEALPGDQAHLARHMRQARPSAVPIAPDNSPVLSTDHVPQVAESRFSSSKLAEKQERRHSFRVPDLPAIASQSGTESNDSSVPSLSTPPSADLDQTEQVVKKKRQSQLRRESQDIQWSGYLLSLAAKTAEKQLREQAMAAYPNEHTHEPVDHYAIDRDSDESEVEAGVGKLQVDGSAEEEVADRSPAGQRRHRDSDAGWDKTEMRKHQEKLEQQKRDQWAAEPSDIGRRKSTRRALQDAENAYKDDKVIGAPPRNIIGWQKDNEMKPMQKAASPPMAGEDLKFPKCLSPQTTRLDMHQYPSMKKSDDVETRQHSGLWTPDGGASRKNSINGLWNGVCNITKQEAIAPPRLIQSGLLTPAIERGDPFSSSRNYGNTQMPPSPPSSQEGTSSLDTILRREQTIEAELNDAFVTQVYNYLSLGYPNLARKFDLELSKISRIPIEDFRKDDERCNAKGYVGAPEGTGVDATGVMEGDQKCERWCALKLYVREWGRQQPDLGANEELDGGWGARARKGSWAI